MGWGQQVAGSADPGGWVAGGAKDGTGGGVGGSRLPWLIVPKVTLKVTLSAPQKKM